MSSEDKMEFGMFSWRDLTVENAEEIRDFYKSVVGWESEDVDMGGYNDYSMNTPGSGETVAGICHARGGNTDLPPQWLVYVVVEDVEQSAARCPDLGGEVLAGPRPLAGGTFCVIKDPAGAVCALFQPPGSSGQ